MGKKEDCFAVITPLIDAGFAGCFSGNKKGASMKRRNPKWWNNEHESSWSRAKEAFKRDWDQTKHDFGGQEPDRDQNVGDTVKQAAGKQPIPPRGMPTYGEAEDAYRFGYGARAHYGKEYSTWDGRLETRLRLDWDETYSDQRWDQYRGSIRRGWDYQDSEDLRKAA
jgi:hypothetical protein